MTHVIDPDKDTTYICHNCRDTMQVRCPTCGGKGCMTCNYNGWVICPYCTKRRRHGDKKGYRHE